MVERLIPAPPLTMRHAASVVIAGLVRELGKTARPARKGEGDAVHRMRVATRRLRAAVRVFGEYVRPPKRVLPALKRLARRLGQVRDRDVLGDLLEQDHLDTLSGAERRKLSALLAVLREQRHAAHRKLAKHLGGARYHRLWRSLDGCAARPEFRGDDDAAAPRMLTLVVERLAEGVARQPAMIETSPDADALHRLRIAFKRLRYVLEFHAETCGLAYAPELKLARAMQDTLGTLHDHDVLLAWMARGDDAFAGPWPELEPRLEAARQALFRKFARLRRQWTSRTRGEPGVTPLAEPRFVSLEAAPVTLRLIAGGKQVASTMIEP